MDNIQMITAAQQGSRADEEMLIKQNTPLVWSIVMRFVGRAEKDDLFQLGLIGLLKAIKRFDAEYGVKFSTYAVPLIIGEIKRFLRDDGIIKISRGLKTLSARVLREKEEIERESGRQASVSEIAAHLDISAEQVTEALEVPNRVESLNAPAGEDGSAEIVEKQASPAQDGEKMLERLALRLAVDTLEEREKNIVKLRYFMDKTQTQTALALGMTQVQVSRLEKKLLAKLRERIG